VSLNPYLLLLTALLFSGCASTLKPQPILATVPLGKLEWAGDLPILTLGGSPYEIGYQHGSLLRREVRASVENAMAFIRKEVGIPFLGKWLAHRTLDRAWAQMLPFVPDRYLEELQGLSEGAGIPLRTLTRVHALPDLMATTCSSFAAFGKATREGRLIQIRNLDWAIHSDFQRYAAIFVYHPEGKRSFVSLGYFGFAGVFSGISDAAISVGQIGAKTVDQTTRGLPMPFLLRRVLEESPDLPTAIRLVRGAPRTAGFHYVFADAIRRQAVALETTRSHCAVFWAGDEEAREVSYALPLTDAIVRADPALDPAVRDVQRCSRGDPSKPGLEPPQGKAYDVRYKQHALLLRERYGQLDPQAMMEVARAIAPPSNVWGIVFAYPEMWVASAVGTEAAARQPYRHYDVTSLFSLEEGDWEEGDPTTLKRTTGPSP